MKPILIVDDEEDLLGEMLIEQKSNVPFVIVSGGNIEDHSDLKECSVKYENFHFLKKPFNAESFEQLLKSLVKNQ
ncbi:hypothetical protein GW915_05365 [bacterium]|nr:hypothetical protein [bacterium]